MFAASERAPPTAPPRRIFGLDLATAPATSDTDASQGGSAISLEEMEQARDLESLGRYSPSSIERRLRSRSNKPFDPHAPSRTAPPPSEVCVSRQEMRTLCTDKRVPCPPPTSCMRCRSHALQEDFWLAAGAPGMEVQQPHARSPVTVAAIRAPAPASAATPAPPTAPTMTAGTASTTPVQRSGAPAFNMFSRDPTAFPVTRIAVAEVALPQVPAFLASYHASVLPMYASLPGCLHAVLHIASDVFPPSTPPADIVSYCMSAARADARERAQKLTVYSITTWHSELDISISEQQEVYKRAMATIGSYFATAPQLTVARTAGSTSRLPPAQT